MDRKVLVILLILLMGVSLLVAGCADRKNAGGGAPTITLTTAPSASMAPTTQPSNVPVFTPTATMPEQSNTPPGGPGLDPSLADISGEGDDLTGFPETGLPTPTLD
jgi:hypothetical protein